MGLSDGRKSFPIGLAVLIQYRSVTASQPPSHVAVAITLNAQASSLIMFELHNCGSMGIGAGAIKPAGTRVPSQISVSGSTGHNKFIGDP